ncbi:MAG: hypothetical protein GXP63_00755 [DPANN group archaeon]|nr:hypothetical protein [DPANN group archaeon]
MVHFGTSGIRGVYGKDITEGIAEMLGQALTQRGIDRLTLARDTRISGPNLQEAIIDGFSRTAAGGQGRGKDRELIDFGVAATPLLCFGTQKVRAERGIMITASHNPSQYNGFKVWDREGMAIGSHEEQEIEILLNSQKRELLEKAKKAKKRGERTDEGDAGAKVTAQDIYPAYFDAVKDAVSLAGDSSVLIDPGNGAACAATPTLLKRYGFRVRAINDRPDGSFPARLPEPNADNLQGTMDAVRTTGAAIGFAHDGDADRMMAIDEKGHIVDFDRFLFFLAQKMIEKTGIRKIVTTVDASMLLDELDARVIRTRVGDTFVAQELAKQKAAFGGEPSGSYIFPSFGLWPDGIYAVFQTLQFLEAENMALSNILAQYPTYHHARMKFFCPEDQKPKAMTLLKDKIPESAEISSVDGLRATFDDFSLLIRPSGTESYLRLNVESKDKAILKEQQAIWEAKVKEAIR